MTMTDQDRVIDSHSSMKNNQVINDLRVECIRRSLMASSSMHITDIGLYYQAVQEFFNNTADVLPDVNVKNVVECMKRYQTLSEKVETDKRYRNLKVTKELFSISQEFFRQIINGLQKYQFWFRVGKRQQKGLTSLSFFTKGIFGKEAEEEYESEDGDDEEVERT